jgi:hypothetical protein
LFCFFVGIVLPPVRTARSAIYRRLLPGVYLLVAKELQGELSSSAAAADDDDGCEGKLMHLWNTLGGGSIAGMTIFEPRVWRKENLVPPLTDIVKKTDSLILSSLVVRSLSEEKKTLLHEMLKDDVEVLQSCAKALQSNDAAHLKVGRKQSLIGDQFTNIYQDGDFIHRAVIRIEKSTLDWLEAVNAPNPPASAEATTKDIRKMYLTYILTALQPYKRMAFALTLPFRPERWDLVTILWTLKNTIGFTILFAMSVYWDNYSEYAIKFGAYREIGAV